MPRGHRPLQSENLEESALYEHRLLWKSCGSWSPDHHRTKQVGMQEAVYVSKQKIANFDGKRAQWPESRRETDLDSARRGTYIKPKVTRSRNRGTGGKVTISARSAQALIGAVPRRRSR